MENMVIRNRLDQLRNEILEFSKAANDCSIQMVSHHSEEIGEIKGELSHGAIITDKTQHMEYDILVESFGKAKRKLLRCTCK